MHLSWVGVDSRIGGSALLTDSDREVRRCESNRSPVRNAILILAIAAQDEQDEYVQLIEHRRTPKGGELTNARKTAVALPPPLA